MSELGYVEGRNIWLEIRYADGAPARLPALAKELVARKPDVIVTGSAAGVLAAQGATKAIPIVMFSILDPVELGVAKSIVRPGGKGDQSRRSADRAADHVRTCSQPQDRQGSRPHNTAQVARTCRRGDRITIIFAALHESAIGT